MNILDRLDLFSLPATAPVEDLVDQFERTPVERRPVESRCILSAGYNAEQGVLELEFPGGWLHRYLGVPAPLYHALLGAPSLGRFYQQRLRGRFIGARWQEAPLARAS